MLVKLAAPAAQASGKQGAEIVFFSWRGQQCVRAYATPAQPRTGLQSQIRSLFTDAQSGWAAVSAVLKQSWEAYAASHPSTDRLGRPVRPTGRNAYTGVNWYRLACGQSSAVTDPSNLLTTAPAPSAITSVATTAGNLVFTVTHPVSPSGQAGVWYLFAEAWIAPTEGYTSAGSRMVYAAKTVTASSVAIGDEATSTVLTIAAATVNPYVGAPSDGKRIFCRFRIAGPLVPASAPLEASAVLL